MQTKIETRPGAAEGGSLAMVTWGSGAGWPIPAGAVFETILLETYSFTAHIQKWQIWKRNKLHGKLHVLLLNIYLSSLFALLH